MDGRSDLYSVGIVLFEMLTGEAMFAPKSDLEAIELAGYKLIPVDISQFQAADGGLTCLSILF